MKLTLIAGLLLAIFGFSGVVRADSEQIDSFADKITIQSDGLVQVTETIVYNFGTGQKHGIFRDIPLTVKDGPELDIDVIGVKDVAGKSYNHTESTSGDTLHIKIGDANTFVSGVKTYVVTYEVSNAIRQFEDHDELYWNVTGNDWQVGIRSVSASISLPSPGIAGLTMACFTGAVGPSGQNCTSQEVDGTAQYVTTGPMDVGEGMTVVLGMPKGVLTVAAPSQDGGISGPVLFLIFSLFMAAVAAIFFFVLLRQKKNKIAVPVIPKELQGEPVVVAYVPPDDLSPIEVGTLLDRRVDITDISSVIIDLAVRGYIKIKYTVEVIKFWPDKKDFELVKLKDGKDLVHPADKIIYKLLFTAGRESVTLSQLQTEKTAFQTTIELIRAGVEKKLYSDKYFDQAEKKKGEKYSSAIGLAGLGFFVFGFLCNIGLAFFALIPFVISTVIACILIFIVSRFDNVLTTKGLTALRKILGFQEFLSLVERDKMRLLNAPELNAETFEKYLPYAMVLGVEQQWSQKFEVIYAVPPDWYDGPATSGFNSYMMVNNLALFNTSFNQVFNITTPSSSSSGFSGGSSGGGSGGGGGGSW